MANGAQNAQFQPRREGITIPLNNLGVVTKWGGNILYRGAQPDRAGFGSLWSMGVKTIFKLNGDEEFRDAVEKDWFVEDYSIQDDDLALRCWPLPGILRANWTDNVIMIVSAIDAAFKLGHVFVHCTHGVDRTGLIAAAYRVVYRGASLADVQKERVTYGISPIRDLIDYQDHEVLKELFARVQAGRLPPK
jgi:protein tyrosine/serine phosphatase